MTPREKLAEAKAKLMLEHPYLGALAAGLETVEESETLTFRSDGETLRYNPEYFEQAPSDELMFALANGALHIMFHHTQRKARRVTRIWQAAIDIAVNAILRKNDFSLPPYAYYDERFEGMYAEEMKRAKATPKSTKRCFANTKSNKRFPKGSKCYCRICIVHVSIGVRDFIAIWRSI